MPANNSWGKANRLGGLRRFAVAITVLNILGHTVFGFEQSWAQPLIAVATAYATEILLETVDAWSKQRKSRFAGGVQQRIDFLLSAHISGLAVSMLLYANDRLWPLVFAAAVAICSKSLMRVRVEGGSRHFMNPSNSGITATLLLFPSVSIAPPYQFTENLYGAGDWILPGIIILSGCFLNARFTHRLPLIAAWLGGFAAQGFIRSALFGMPLAAALLPMTGVAFILYTFYMLTDPATTPETSRGQMLFGVGVALAYGILMVNHVVFGLFLSLSAVCLVRGGLMSVRYFVAQRASAKLTVHSPVMIEEA